MLASFSQWIFKVVYLWSVALYFRPKFYYQNKKMQSSTIKGSAIVVSNHRGPLDFLLLLLAFWTRTLRCIVSESIYNVNPFLRVILWLFGAIKVDRFGRKLDFMHNSLKVLNKGGVIEIFPESRFPLPGETELLPFASSVIYLALKSGVPIIPIYHKKRSSFFERTKIAIGAPVYAKDLLTTENPCAKEMIEASEKLRSIVTSLRDEYVK